MQRVLAQLLDLSSESMISIGADGVVTSWNLASTTLYGWQPHEAVGRSIAELVGHYPEAATRAIAATGLWEGSV